MAAGVSRSYLTKRRSVRYKLDVPLRVILHKEDATLLRDGRGTEISQLGMCVIVGLELSLGMKLRLSSRFRFQGNQFELRARCGIVMGTAMGVSLSPTVKGSGKTLNGYGACCRR